MECQNSDTPVFIKRLFMECSSDVDWNLLSWNMYEAELHLGCVLLVPLFPYNLQNFAYGVTDIPFSTYSIFSLIFMLPGTAMYTIGTSGLADKENRVLYISIAVILAVIVMGVLQEKVCGAARGSGGCQWTGKLG